MAYLLVAASSAQASSVVAWQGNFPRFYETRSEDLFALSEVFVASVHMLVLVAQLCLCHYCYRVLETSTDEDEQLARRLNALYKAEAFLFAPVLVLWVLSCHSLGVFLLLPTVAIRLFWFKKNRLGIDLRAREPAEDCAFRSILMMIGHFLSSFVVGARLFWPRYQLDISNMDICSEYFYLFAQSVVSIAFLGYWFFLPAFLFKCGTHFFGSGLVTHQKTD
ncbi:hypothetical protein AB1Y20_013211 [Prymnesium parvum]|uniref:Uncharacterized protein n=1 Tax=Prymnesium parvum TaxID=97485 RepID=A0AB34IMI1_PRYPA